MSDTKEVDYGPCMECGPLGDDWLDAASKLPTEPAEPSVSLEEMKAELSIYLSDLYITFAGSYKRSEATEFQVCDGSGRDGMVYASGRTEEEAIRNAYSKLPSHSQRRT